MTSVVRVDPKAISTSFKEAVVDSLLNLVHARISGTGEFGAVLYGTRPRNLLNSAFLLPMRGAEEGDEVTSPIWISSHGLDFQIAKDGSGDIVVQPRFAIYVRILPSEDDIKREDCRPSFRLKREVAKELNKAYREALDAEWEKVKGSYKNRREHPSWLKIKDEVRGKIYSDKGVPLDLTRVGYSDDEDADIDAEGEIGPIAEGVIVSVGKGVQARDEHFEPLRIPHKWLRLDLELPPLAYPVYAESAIRTAAVAAHEQAMQQNIQERIAGWANNEDLTSGGKLWGFRRDEKILPSQYRDWRKFLEDIRKRGNPPVLPDISPKWDIIVAPDWLDSARLNVHVALENRSRDPKQHVEETDVGLFQVSIMITAPRAVHRPLKLERVEPSYRYNRFLAYPAMGFNGGVVRMGSQDGPVVLETTWAPRFIQPRIIPKTYEDVECSIRRLSDPASFSKLKPVTDYLRRWLETLPQQINTRAGLDSNDKDAIEREENKFREDCHKWKLEIKSIETGLAILEESKKHWVKRGPQSDQAAIPFEAWLAMNEAMADLMKDRFKQDDMEWRLFQLCFILANLPAIATRIKAFEKYYSNERDDAVTLLYFSTGGGKSEAFFGLLVFTLFFDRLRGKHVGVSAMIRYPLRLLTIQQAQRASRVLAKAEIVRRKYKYQGQPLSIGFWVGSGGSPNRLNGKGVGDVKTITEASADPSVEASLLESDAKYATAVKAWNKIPRCPFCNSKTALRRFPSEGGTLGHVCTNKDCFSNEGKYQPIPFYICDEDIYDFAPSVVLGTVDKLALIGHYPTTIRRVMGMFGAAVWRRRDNGRFVVPSPAQLDDGPEENGCEKIKPAYQDGIDVFFDPFPALLIQDEAHLLDESLGTFAGLFESTLDSVFAELAKSLKEIVTLSPDGKRRRAKVIAASATVADPERQLEHLYQRMIPAIQFPYPGPDLYESFYAYPERCVSSEQDRYDDPNIEVRSKQARIYVGYMTNGRPHTATSVAVLSNFHLAITELFTAFVSGEPSQVDLARKLMARHLSVGPLRVIHHASLAAASAGEFTTIIDLHRIALTYVTNKKGGDQIMAAEAEETRKRHGYYGLPFDQLTTRLITGSVDQGEIQNVVDTAQTRPSPGQPFNPLEIELRSVIATSAISHGVDVEEFNSMFFAGMPSDVAEYIQASSRVGRTHIGFCVLIPTPQRRRDRFIIEVFDVYHRFLERMVQPAAIDRWAEKAIERVLPSLFQSFVCGTKPSCGIIEAAELDKPQVRTCEAISDILATYRDGEKAFYDGVLGFIGRSLGLDGGFAPEGTPFYQERIERRIRELVSRIGERDWSPAPLPSFFKNQTDPMWRPMTSLRDVDQSGVIRLATLFPGRTYQDPAAAKAVMALIRNGVAEGGDDLDEEG